MYLSVALVLLGVLWLAAEMKTSRSDGRLLAVHPIRRIMLFIMPSRNESVVYFDATADVEALEAFLASPAAKGGHITHATVAAAGMALSATPKMNRFVMGGRLYERTERMLSFSMKRARMDKEAAISTVKLTVRDGETFEELVTRIDSSVKVERSGTKTRTDKEIDIFNALPRPLLRLGVVLLRWLDTHNLLPRAFIGPDPLYTSIFIANLGSLGMGPGYHHLFEYGTCPLFIMIGQIEERVVARDGVPTVRRVLPVRFTYDERIEDGLNARFGIDRFIRILENPDKYLGQGALWPRDDVG